MLRIKDLGTHRLISSLLETIFKLSEYVSASKYELEKSQKEYAEAQNKCSELQKENEKLKEQLNLNPENSSKPSSSQAPHERKSKKSKNNKPKSKLKCGGQKGHKGHARILLPTDKIDKIILCNPVSDCNCGGKILPKKLRQRHQVHDFDDGKLCLFEYQIYDGKCDLCKAKYLGRLPDGISLRMLGPAAIAKITLLTTKYDLSKRKAQNLLLDFHNLKVSTGTISNAEKLTGDALEKPVAEAHEHTKQSASLHADETGHFQKHKLAWMWVAVSMMTTIFMIMPSRSQKAAKQLLGKNYAGKLISDRYSAYNWIDLQNRQACWAHLIRDFTRISQRSGKAGRIGELLLYQSYVLFNWWHKIRDGTIDRSLFVKRASIIQENIHKLLQKGGALEETKTANTCRRLLKAWDSLWLFVRREGIESTNNAAERALRQYVIWRKINLGTQSERGDRFIERMFTVIATCKQQGRSVLDFMTQAVQAYLGGAKTPSLIST